MTDLAAIKERHRQPDPIDLGDEGFMVPRNPYCEFDHQPWPCDIERIAAVLPPGQLTLTFGGTALEAAQALYDAGLRPSVEPAGLAEAVREFFAVRDVEPPQGPGPSVAEVERFWREQDVRERMALERMRALLPTQASDSPENP